MDITGPVSSADHIDFRLAGAWESSDTNIKYQKNKHYFIAPTLSWKPTPTTSILIDTEYGNSHQNGYGFQALRAAQGNSSTPINNDQLEAVAFYFPPGADPRTVNLSGPDTFNSQQESNIEIKATQEVLKETRFLPEVDALLGYNHSSWAAQTQSVNGEITGPISSGLPGYNLSQTIYTLGADNGINGETVANNNLLFGPLPNSVIEYEWNQANQQTSRDQERAEVTGGKSVFDGKWYHVQDQFLAGFSELCNQVTKANWETVPGLYNYKSPNDLTPIIFGTQGDGTPDQAMYQNDVNNIDKVWDAGYYFNNYAKLFNFWGADDRVILMDGYRHDKIDSWSTDTTISAPGATPSTTASRAMTIVESSYQNGLMIKLTKNISIYGLKSEGLQPNFGGLHNNITGAPVGADTGKSRELGIKFDFLDGKISGTISKYTITKTAWEGQPWFVPAPMGRVLFNPNKDIVYELSGGFNALTAPDPRLPGVAPSSSGGPQTDPTVIAAWNAALNAGAITHLSPLTGAAAGPNSIYIDCSAPAGAAYMNSVFAATQSTTWNGAWPGWLYNGAGSDPNTNNATWDATGFSGKGSAAWQVIDQSKGYDGQILITPNDHLQIVLTGSIDATVRRLNLGQWPEYPYPQDKWAVWYFPNGSWGLENEPLNVAYTNPANTATRTNAGAYPGDDTPRYAGSLWTNYKFGGGLKGLTVGIGGTWHSQEEFFSGVTHGSGQLEINTAGQPIVAYSPSQLLVNLFAKYEWKRWGHNQFVQLNVDNVFNDQKLYGLIYSTPLTARISYGVGVLTDPCGNSKDAIVSPSARPLALRPGPTGIQDLFALGGSTRALVRIRCAFFFRSYDALSRLTNDNRFAQRQRWPSMRTARGDSGNQDWHRPPGMKTSSSLGFLLLALPGQAGPAKSSPGMSLEAGLPTNHAVPFIPAPLPSCLR